MVHANRRCSHDSCSMPPSFNVEGSKTAAYCRRHAMRGMVNVVAKRCLHDTCSAYPSFNVEGSASGAYCK
ncbi:unnamed protein product [Laminaria digitata]